MSLSASLSNTGTPSNTFGIGVPSPLNKPKKLTDALPISQYGGITKVATDKAFTDKSAANKQAATEAKLSGGKPETQLMLENLTGEYKKLAASKDQVMAAVQEQQKLETMFDKFGQIPPKELMSNKGLALVRQYYPNMDEAKFANEFVPMVYKRQQAIQQLSKIPIGTKMDPAQLKQIEDIGISNPEKYMALHGSDFFGGIGNAIGGAVGAVGNAIGGAAGAVADAGLAALRAPSELIAPVAQAAAGALPGVLDVAGKVGASAINELPSSFAQAVRGQAQTSSELGNPLAPLKAGFDQEDKMALVKAAAEGKANSGQQSSKTRTFLVNENGEKDETNGKKLGVFGFNSKTGDYDRFMGVSEISSSQKNANRLENSKTMAYIQQGLHKELAKFGSNLNLMEARVKQKLGIEAAIQTDASKQAIGIGKTVNDIKDEIHDLDGISTSLEVGQGALDRLYKKGGAGVGSGTISELINAVGPSDPDVGAFKQNVAILQAFIQRELGKEKGALSNDDKKAFKAALPALNGEAPVNEAVFKGLYDRINVVRGTKLESIADANDLMDRYNKIGGNRIDTKLLTDGNTNSVSKAPTAKTGNTSAPVSVTKKKLTPQQIEYQKKHPGVQF